MLVSASGSRIRRRSSVANDPPVARAITETGRAARRLAERTIKAAGSFHRVAHDGDMLKIILIERGSDRPHHAVNHTRRRDHIGSRFSMDD